MSALLNHRVVKCNIQAIHKLENNILGTGQSKNPMIKQLV